MIAITGCSEKSSESTDSAEGGKGKVYFVCRSQYEIPLGHRIVEFQSSTLLDWFHDNWISDDLRKWLLDPPQEGAWVPADKPESEWTDEDVIPINNYDPIHKHTEELLKGDVYGFTDVWEAMAKWGKNPPKNTNELKEFISTINYYGEITFDDGALQCLTDDDEIEIAWYLFDDGYAQRNPERVAYLLHPTWELPELAGIETSVPASDKSHDLSDSGGTPTDGVVYCVFLSAQDGMTLLEMTGTYRFSGVRLPGFAQFLRSREVPIEKTQWNSLEPTWPDELILLRALSHSTDVVGFAEFLTDLGTEVLNSKAAPARAFRDLRYRIKEPDFLAGQGRSYQKDFARLESHIEEARKENRSVWVREMLPARIQVSDHFCQIRFHERLNTKEGHDHQPVNYTWAYIFFDDHWVAANSGLAQSILHYGSGWQALYEAEPVVSR